MQLTVFALGLASIASAAPAVSIRDTASVNNKYTAPNGQSSFQLEALAANGNLSYSGLFLTGFHTGAGESVPVATQNQTDAIAMHFNSTSGDVYYLGGSPPAPYSLAFLDAAPYMSDAPAGYKLVTQNVGEPHSGLSFRPRHRNVIDVPLEYNTFALCNVNGTAPYFGVGAETQLFWRGHGVAVERSGKCADVLLKAVFNHAD